MKVRIGFVREVLKKIGRKTYVDDTLFTQNKNLIIVDNGVINFNIIGNEMNCSLTEHSPDILSTNMLNVKYDPNATCPKIDKFLTDITKYNPKAYINIKKMFGYCLYQSCKYQRAFMLYGLGDNGKSVLLDLLGIFLGTDNTCHIALHELCDEKSKFVVGELNGKLANIYSDIPLKTLHDVSIFKATVAGDRIKGEFKHMKPFYFSSYAVHVYSTKNTSLL